MSDGFRSGDRLRGGGGERVRLFLSGRDELADPPSKRGGLRDEPRRDFLW